MLDKLFVQARLAIENQIASLGSNLVAVNSGPPPSVGRQPIPLYLTDARAILEHCPSVVEVSPQQETRLAVSFGSNQLASNFVMGVTSSYARVRLADLAKAGSFRTAMIWQGKSCRAWRYRRTV